jgi:hypothetical protein
MCEPVQHDMEAEEHNKAEKDALQVGPNWHRAHNPKHNFAYRPYMQNQCQFHGTLLR